jgi:predicted Zn-dependent protease
VELKLVGLLIAATLASAQTPEGELREGVALTSRGRFEQAIPHFLAARGQVTNTFALEFNLALCYVGTRQFKEAVEILERLPAGARTKNLLAQALVGDHQEQAAWKVFSEAAALAPKDESLYVLLSQACLDEAFPDLARKVVETGLGKLPDSPKLHFQKGILESQQDDAESAAREFQTVQLLAPGSEIAFIATGEQALYEGRMADVIRAAREGVQKGYQHYLLLTMLGEALLRSGATPDTPAELNEAQTALEKAVAARPSYASSHIALGRVYLLLGRAPEAIAQLETGRHLDPRNKAVYPPLAAAYQRSQQPDKAKEALAALAELNKQDADRIRNADGGHAGYVSGKKKP